MTLTGLPETIEPHVEPIKEDGTITLPDIGPVQAAGKTAGELQNEIYNLYVPKLLPPSDRHREYRRSRLLRRRRSQTARTPALHRPNHRHQGHQPPATSPILPTTKRSGSSAPTVSASKSIATRPCKTQPRTRRFIPAIKSRCRAGFSDDSTQHSFGKKGGHPIGCPPFSFPHRPRGGKRTATGRRRRLGSAPDTGI